MKRLFGMTVVVCGSIVVGFAACGKAPTLCDPDSLLQKAQLCPDRDSLGFGQEFGSGTFVGQTGFQALAIRNGGIEDLNVTSVAIAGDPAFTYRASWDDNLDDMTIPATVVKGNKTVFVEVRFTPTAAKAYSGSLSFTTSAANTPSKVFQVTGCGVPTDGGLSPCHCAAAAQVCQVATPATCCSGKCKANAVTVADGGPATAGVCE